MDDQTTPNPDRPPDEPASPSTPTVPTEPTLPPGTPLQPASAQKRSRRRLLLIGVGVFVLVMAGLALRTIVTQTAVDYAAQFFGGPLQRLPADQREALGLRFDTMLGDRFDGMSNQEIAADLERLVRGGMPRLDDARLVTRLQLQTKGLDAMTEAECAEFGRPSMSGQPVPNSVGQTLMKHLEAADLGVWLDIAADAVEAELAGTSPARRVSDAEAEQVFKEVFEGVEGETLTLITDVSANQATATDADVCTAIRTIYDLSLELASPSIELLARYDIS
jgi:hypothetical protein